MFGFLIKKSFFDLWDNFLAAVLANLGFIVVLSIPLTLPSMLNFGGAVLSLAVLFLGIILIFVYLGGIYALAKEITDYQAPTWLVFVDGIRASLPTTLILGGIVLVHLFLISIGVPVYSSFGNIYGLIALALLFWMSVIWLLSAQYILPVRGRLDKDIRKILKKSFLLSFDNTFFTIAMASGAVFIMGISIFTALLFPGIMGLAIWHHTAVKLRLYKYDYLEEHPDEPRNAIPWDALLYDDRERVGKRTLRGMIFHWKE